METPPQITFQGPTPSDHVRAKVQAEVEKLEKYFGRIVSCRVVLGAGGGRRRHGDLYETSIYLSLPGGREVAATRNPGADHAHEDPLVAIRDAFRAARRQLQDQVRESRGKVKHHAPPAIATVKALSAEQEYGRLETPDGREIYFHRNSVLNDAFDRLKVGDRVSYHEEQGEKGPQASTVKILGKHGLL